MTAERHVRLFLSVDLVGSTAYKNKSRSVESYSVDGPAWVKVFKNFYFGFPKMFAREMASGSLPERHRPRLVKIIGDELLLQTPIEGCKAAQEIVCFFAEALHAYTDKNLRHENLLLKGTAWVAGFPINNHRIVFEDEGGMPGREDFIGPSIDAGFRITRFSSPQRLAVSVDLALMLASGKLTVPLYFDGTEELKGVLGGRPYPRIWCKVGGAHAPLHDAELKLRNHTASHDDLAQYCREFIKSCDGTWLTLPYFEGDPVFNAPPAWHTTLIETLGRVDRNNFETEPSAPSKTKRASQRQRHASKRGLSKKNKTS